MYIMLKWVLARVLQTVLFLCSTAQGCGAECVGHLESCGKLFVAGYIYLELLEIRGDTTLATSEILYSSILTC